MIILSFIVLILLSLVGYSSGAVLRAGKSSELKPRMIDLLVILLIWAGAIYCRLTFSLNKWLLVAIWLSISYVLGIVILSLRKHPPNKKPADTQTPAPSGNYLKKLWKTWGQFSKRMGAFQSRMLLSLFFFLFLTPVSLIIKAFSDPLNIKHRNQGASGSYWLSKESTSEKIEDFRRQF